MDAQTESRAVTLTVSGKERIYDIDLPTLPDWIEEKVETPGKVLLTPLTLDGRTSIHQVRRAFGPGAVELRWGYGEREGQPG